MSRAILWLSGFAFGGGLCKLSEGDWWGWFLLTVSIAAYSLSHQALASTKNTGGSG